MEGEKEARKTNIASGELRYEINRDLESVGGEWRTTGKDRKNWRLLIDNVET